MLTGYHLSGDAPLVRKLKLGAAQANAGILMIGGGDGAVGAIPCTTTSFANVQGLAIDRGIYSTTQGDAEGLVSVDIRPDLVVRARMCGGSTEGTSLTTLSNTSASSGGTVVTDADVGSADMDGGRVWCISGANVGQSRNITTHTGSTSVTVTVPFPHAIAVGDTFLMCPWNVTGPGASGADGMEAVQTTTVFTEADATIATATGGVASVVDLELNGAADSYVLFVAADHVYNFITVSS